MSAADVQVVEHDGRVWIDGYLAGIRARRGQSPTGWEPELPLPDALYSCVPGYPCVRVTLEELVECYMAYAAERRKRKRRRAPGVEARV